MKTLKTLALAALTVGFMGITNTYADDACDLTKELAALKTAHDDLAAKAVDDDAKAKVIELAKKINDIKNENDQAKACKMVEEVKKAYNIQ